MGGRNGSSRRPGAPGPPHRSRVRPAGL